MEDLLIKKYNLVDYTDLLAPNDLIISQIKYPDKTIAKKYLAALMDSNSDKGIQGIALHPGHNIFSLYSKKIIDKSILDKVLTSYINDNCINSFNELKKEINNILENNDNDLNHISLMDIKDYVSNIKKEYSINENYYLNKFNKTIELKYANKYHIDKIVIYQNKSVCLEGTINDNNQCFEINIANDEYGLCYKNYITYPHNESYSNDMRTISGLIGYDLNNFINKAETYLKLLSEIHNIYFNCINSKLNTTISFIDNRMDLSFKKSNDTYLENIELLRIKFDDDQSKYIYTSNYCNIINLLLDNEETIFKNLLIEIDKLPKWMHNDLINLKSQQLNNNHRKELIK